jgi:hypothetical protein
VEAFGGEGEEKRKPQKRREKRRTDCCGRFSDFWSFSTASRRPAKTRTRSRRQEKDV